MSIGSGLERCYCCEFLS